MYCFISHVIWNPNKLTSYVVWFESLRSIGSNWARTPGKPRINIYRAKGDGAVDHSLVSSLFNIFRLDYKNLNDQARSGRPKTIDTEDLLKAMEANPACSIWWLSRHFIVQYSLSFSRFRQKHTELSSCTTHYQNIDKLLTYLSIFIKR